MEGKEITASLSDSMKRWQRIEDAAVASTGIIIEKTDNPLIRVLMELIQRDSQFHHRIQGFIIDTLEKEAISLTPEELGDIWDLVENHIDLEKQTVKMAEETIRALKGRKMVVQEYLLHYLLEDEEKHNHLLESLEKIKKGMYPYG